MENPQGLWKALPEGEREGAMNMKSNRISLLHLCRPPCLRYSAQWTLQGVNIPRLLVTGTPMAGGTRGPFLTPEVTSHRSK